MAKQKLLKLAFLAAMIVTLGYTRIVDAGICARNQVISVQIQIGNTIYPHGFCYLPKNYDFCIASGKKCAPGMSATMNEKRITWHSPSGDRVGELQEIAPKTLRVVFN